MAPRPHPKINAPKTHFKFFVFVVVWSICEPHPPENSAVVRVIEGYMLPEYRGECDLYSLCLGE